MPGVFTTAPFGASEPRRMARPPSGLNGSLTGRTTLPSGSNASATLSPSVRPLTVIALPSIRPADSSSFRITGTPPTRSSSLMMYRPDGRIDAITGVRRLISSKSSIDSSTPASWAIASRCRTALVEPAVAITTVAALRNAVLVMICRGRSPVARARTTASPVRRARSVRSAETAGADASPGSVMPSASAQVDIVLAVYMPAHDPAPGQAARSTASRSASDMVPAECSPTASNTSWIVTALPCAQPGRMVPPYRNAAGMSSRAHAISMPGSDLSQPAIATSASNCSAFTISSTESAMTSRLTSEDFMPSVPMEMPSETAMVPNSSGTAPAWRTPSLAAAASPFRWTLQGVTSFQEDAMATCGRSRSSSDSPTARSIARAAARDGPVVSGPDRGLGKLEG